MRTERLLNTRFFVTHKEARRRLFIAVYGRLAMFRKRFDKFRAERLSVLVALVKALTAKKAELHHRAHHVYQKPRELHTQRR
jgi:hypothetical protein